MVGSYTVTLRGSGGAAANAPSASATLQLVLQAAPPAPAPPTPVPPAPPTPPAPPAPSAPASGSRTRYVRTDATGTSSFFDASRNLFLVSDAQLGRITALNPTTESVVATLAVPGALGMDETPDHSTIYAASLVGDVYAIDVASMTVKHRYLSSQIGTIGFTASAVRVLANGQLALLGGEGPISGVDGASVFAVWTPSTNALTTYASAYGASSYTFTSIPITVVCAALGNIGAFTLTGDRTRIVVGSIDSDSTLCTVDPATGGYTAVTARGNSTVIAASPDGNSLVLPSYQDASLVVYNAHTLAQTALFPVQANTDSDSSILVSNDSKTVYATGGSDVFAYNIGSGAALGWLPSLYLPQLFSSFGTSTTHPILQAMDNSGLLFGPMEEGVAFLDTTVLHPGTVGTEYLNGYLTPNVGPAAGGTSVQSGGSSPSGIASVFFGPNQATSVSESSSLVYAISPAGSPGPADVITTANDGGVQTLPEAFSYGPTILEATPDASSAEGGATGVIFGYGFGPVGGTTVPSDVHLTVGGASATLTGFQPNAYGVGSPPFPLEALAYTVPAGLSGPADLVLTSANGSATAAGGLTYLPATQQFPLAGASLAQGIYDPVHQMYYFTNTGEIEVFSRSAKRWLSPITVPAAPNGAAHRLWGLALSTDGTKLAVSDAGTGQLFLLNPNGTTVAQTFLFTSGRSDVLAEPAGVAVSNNGTIYFGVFYPGGDTGFPGFYKLNPANGAFTSIAEGPGEGSGDAQLRPILSVDNTRLFLNIQGQIEYIDIASGDAIYSTTGQSCCYGTYDLAVSSNQTSVAASEYLLDSDMNGEAPYSYNVRESADITFVYGTKLSPDGTLLFQPGTGSIDVIDGHRGTLLHRVALPFALSQTFDALVSDGLDNTLIAITGIAGDGIAIVDLTGVPEPAPLAYGPDIRTSRAAARSVKAVSPKSSGFTLARGLAALRIPHSVRPFTLHR